MKKMLFSIIALIALLGSSYANDPVKGGVNKDGNQSFKEVELQAFDEGNEDALYCSLYVNGNLYECWVCDCSALAKIANQLEKDKENNGNAITKPGLKP